jgi:hypothetical protein
MLPTAEEAGTSRCIRFCPSRKTLHFLTAVLGQFRLIAGFDDEFALHYPDFVRSLAWILLRFGRSMS